MREFVNFFVSHWQLSGLFLLFLGAYLWLEFYMDNSSYNVPPEKAVELYNHQHAVILDVRSVEAFQSQHIIGSVAIVDDTQSKEIETQIRKLNKYAQKPVIVVCADGKTSSKFAAKLNSSGFAQVHVLAGGIRAWQDAGLPLINKG